MQGPTSLFRFKPSVGKILLCYVIRGAQGGIRWVQ